MHTRSLKNELDYGNIMRRFLKNPNALLNFIYTICEKDITYTNRVLIRQLIQNFYNKGGEQLEVEFKCRGELALPYFGIVNTVEDD